MPSRIAPQLSEAEEAWLLHEMRMLTIHIDDMTKNYNARGNDREPWPCPKREELSLEVHASLAAAIRHALKLRHETAVALGIGDRYPAEIQ